MDEVAGLTRTRWLDWLAGDQRPGPALDWRHDLAGRRRPLHRPVHVAEPGDGEAQAAHLCQSAGEAFPGRLRDAVNAFGPMVHVLVDRLVTRDHAIDASRADMDDAGTRVTGPSHHS